MQVGLIWIPRVLAILMVLFLSVFALDVFGEGHGFWRTAGALLMHLAPAFLVAGALAIAWWRPWAGAVLFIALAALYMVWGWGRFPWSTFAVIAGPLLVTGALFLAQAFAVLRSAR